MAQDETEQQGAGRPTRSGTRQAAKKRPARKQPSKQPSKGSAEQGHEQDHEHKHEDKHEHRHDAEDGAARRAAATTEPPRRRGAGAIARDAAEQIHELTGHEVEGISGVRRVEDDWVVEVDVLELRRIPATTDVLATYEVELDDDGTLLGYRRRHRFVRGNVGDHR